MLDDESQDLCVIVTPFGKYKYLRLPMGIKQSPDVAQEIMEDVLQGLDDVEVYIDNIGIFPWIGPPMYKPYIAFCIISKRMGSPLPQAGVNRVSKKLIGLVIG